MFVQFELDENFNEVIRSRHRDVFTYTNFSEGERLRIDLSIMFTWRHISKMKNSVNTNLLIMDEIVDNRLDTKTVELFLQIVRRLENTHVFIISHRDDIVEKFDRTITFTKKNEFSLMEIS
jgi:DNA repair exonuclease SbcCD ATPase subunit